MNGTGVDRDAVVSQLERILASASFRQTERSAGLLRYLVERSLKGADERVKEYTVGVEALGRGAEFDPRTDPIVRAEASRLRERLARYYASDGQQDAVVIELPRGTYAVRFSTRPKLQAPVVPTGEVVSPPVPNRTPRRILPLALGAVAVLGAFTAGLWTARPTPAVSAPKSLEVRLQADELLGSDVGVDVVVSPDGSRAVFVSLDSLGATHLRVRQFDQPAPTDLPGTTGGRGPFWSPDSKWIGFWAAGELRKVAVGGGAPVVLCNAPDLLGASWSDDGSIVAALDATSRLVRVAASGGAPVTVVDLTQTNAEPRWPQVLPGGTHVIYTAISAGDIDRATIEVVSLADGDRRVLVQGGTFGRYLAPNYLTFTNQGTLYAVRFDAKRLTVSGEKAPVLENVAYSSTFGFAQFSASETGVAVYRSAQSSGPLVVAMLDSAGQRTPLLDAAAQYSWPSISPDGERLAVGVVESGSKSLTVYTNLRTRPRVAWSKPGLESPAWSRDGRYVVARGSRGLEWIPSLGGNPRVLVPSANIQVPWSFFPGDTSIAYLAMDPATAFDLWTAPIRKQGDGLSAGEPKPLLRTPAFETYPAISPDGGWVAYWSNDMGATELYVRSLADTSVKVALATGGRVPRWSRTGQRLFYTTADQRLMVVDYTTRGRTFTPNVARQWTPVRFADTGVLANYDVVDDRHVVALLPQRADDAWPTHVKMVIGFPEALRQKLP